MSATLIANELAPRNPSAGTPRPKRNFPELVETLSRKSVDKHFDAYLDVAWDSEAFRIDPSDPRWQLPESDALGGSAWYKAQSDAERSRIGLKMVANQMKIGLQFESVLQRGLLEFASGLPNHSPEFRYVYHEVIEEAQHTLMFQEFINRSGADSIGLDRFTHYLSRQLVRAGRLFPELFFMFVLGGEDPIDRVQREALHSGQTLHPLHARLMQIHVTEEARHLCFAQQYLRERVPALGAFRRLVLSLATPVILVLMAKLMLQPTPQLCRECRIPSSVIKQAYANDPRQRAKLVEVVAKLRALCDDLQLITPPFARLWRWLGLAAPASCG